MITYIHSKLSKLLPEKALMFIVELYYSSMRVLLYCLRIKYIPNLIIKFFESFGIKVVQFENIGDYAKDQPNHVTNISRTTKHLYYSPACFDYLHFNTSMIKSEKESLHYTALLKQATVIGGSNLILTNNGKALFDLKYHNTEHKYRYTDGAILSDNDDYCLVKATNSNHSFDQAIFMAGNFSFSYYHLLYEILVKFQHIENLALDKNIPLLVDKINMDIPQYRELFTMLNKNERPLLPIEKGQSYSVKQLYYISCPNIIPPNFWAIKNIKAEDNLFDLASLTYIRSKLLTFSTPTQFPKRIFLSRRKASERRPFNETDVSNLFKKYGFITVFPEDYSIAEQISMFNNADFIAGGTGGAFTNLLFCKAGCNVFCFTNYALDLSIFSTVAKHVNANLLYIADESKDISTIKNIHESFHIDLDRLDDIVRHWIT